jgi:hypothetical protein
VWLQVVTDAEPFNPIADENSSNCVKLTGTGLGLQKVSLDGVRAAQGTEDHVSFYVRATSDSLVAGPGGYGTPNNGSNGKLLNAWTGSTRVTLDASGDGASWNVTGSGSISWSDGGFLVRLFHPQTSNPLGDFPIKSVPSTSSLIMSVPSDLHLLDELGYHIWDYNGSSLVLNNMPWQIIGGVKLNVFSLLTRTMDRT